MDKPNHQPNVTRDDWRHYMEAKINRGDAPVLTQSWMILKPYQALVEVKPAAYTPKLVTIGPLYHNPQPSPIDNYKALCVKKYMERHGISAVKDLIHDLISDQPHELSHIYNLNLPQSEIEWLQLLVTVDTIFIHEYLLFCMEVVLPGIERVGYFGTFRSNEPTFQVRIQRDLFLIGNQIPMSFLKKIALEIPCNPDSSLADFENIVRIFSVAHDPFVFTDDGGCRLLRFLELENINLVDECQHLLDSIYYSCTVEDEESMRQTNSEESQQKRVRLPSASQLYKSGIRFKACEGNISVMKYDKTKLQLHLPRLVVFDETEDVLRNLLAHEISSKEGGDFSMYADIMDMLIDTEEDLAILTKANVLENHTGNGIRVVQMWNDMGTNIPLNYKSERWGAIVPIMMDHYSSRWLRLYAECYEKFFSRPWLWISVIAASLLLAASILQTGYSIAGYYKKPTT